MLGGYEVESGLGEWAGCAGHMHEPEGATFPGVAYVGEVGYLGVGSGDVLEEGEGLLVGFIACLVPGGANWVVDEWAGGGGEGPVMRSRAKRTDKDSSVDSLRVMSASR